MPLLTAVYVSNAGSKDIHVLAMDRDSGRLTALETVPVGGSEGPSPSSLPLAVTPDRRFLIAALRIAPFPAVTFAIDPASGRLARRSSTYLADSMCYLSIDNGGRYLFSASYAGSKLAVNPIAEDGRLGAALQVIGTEPTAHCVLPGPDGQRVYATSLGGDVVTAAAFDPATGRLGEPVAVLRTASGAGPRHLLFHPQGAFAYLVSELDGTVGAYRLDPATGALDALQVLSQLPPGFAEKPAAADLHITPDGRFLYASERTTSTLAAFAVDPATGTLTAIGRYSTELEPRGFTIDPRGRFLLAAGLRSNRLTVYAIGADGRLDAVGHHPMGDAPNWIEVVDLA